MKTLCVVAILLTSTSAAPAQNDLGLPELHAIKTASLSPSYSCRSPEEVQKGYEGTALFLSAYSRQRNSPDLLFDGSCDSPDYFQVSTAGDDMALVADLGENVPVEKVRAQDAMYGYCPVPASKCKAARYAFRLPVVAGHTYAALINKREIRGLFVFTVTGYTQNTQVALRYAVKEYQVQTTAAQSPGFSWSSSASEKR